MERGLTTFSTKGLKFNRRTHSKLNPMFDAHRKGELGIDLQFKITTTDLKRPKVFLGQYRNRAAAIMRARELKRSQDGLAHFVWDSVGKKLIEIR